MKRSEAVKKIEEALRQDLFNSGGFSTNRDKAELVMKVVEELGMLPPSYNTDTICDEFGILNADMPEPGIFSWEPE